MDGNSGHHETCSESYGEAVPKIRQEFLPFIISLLPFAMTNLSVNHNLLSKIKAHSGCFACIGDIKLTKVSEHLCLNRTGDLAMLKRKRAIERQQNRKALQFLEAK